MNCEDFEEVVVDLARSQPLEAGARNEARAHAAECEACAERLEKEQALSIGLRALAADMKSAATTDNLERNLISAFRQEGFMPHVSRGSNRWSYLAIAAAVILAVTLAVAGFRMRASSPVESNAQSSPPNRVLPSPAATPSSDGRATNSPVLKEIKKEIPRVASTHRPKKRRPSVSVSPTFVSVVVGSPTDSEASEVASSFMPLGYSNTATLQEGAQVMRVELPRYAMARFGLPVNMERYDERVKADVWIGADGLARAIRFVQ
jgi:hypothetical protein